eukprot:gene1617-12742_t
MFIFDLLITGLGYLFFISLIINILFVILPHFFPNQNLKEKYQTNWALVTGGSSGIGFDLKILTSQKGLKLVSKLAEQNINVIIIANEFSTNLKHLIDKHKNVEFKFLSIDLSKDDSFDEVIKNIKNYDIRLLFNNVGYLNCNTFESIDLESHIKHINCNLMIHVKLSHYFYSNLIKNKLKGGICFTSSCVPILPSPFISIYGSTKSFLSQFSRSLSIEAKLNNIDVFSFNPQFNDTNLYKNSPKLLVLKIMKIFGSDPNDCSNLIFNCIGRITSYDQVHY